MRCKFTGAALIANAAALTLRSGLRPALLVGGLSVVIGPSLALLFALGTPWRGAITVSGQPIDTVIDALGRRVIPRLNDSHIHSSSPASSAVSPGLEPDQQVSSTRDFLREPNRFGITSAIDAAGGSQQLPGQLRWRVGLFTHLRVAVRPGYGGSPRAGSPL